MSPALSERFENLKLNTRARHWGDIDPKHNELVTNVAFDEDDGTAIIFYKTIAGRNVSQGRRQVVLEWSADHGKYSLESSTFMARPIDTTSDASHVPASGVLTDSYSSIPSHHAPSVMVYGLATRYADQDGLPDKIIPFGDNVSLEDAGTVAECTPALFVCRAQGSRAWFPVNWSLLEKS